MEWYRVGRRWERLTVRFLFFVMIGYLIGVYVIEHDAAYVDSFGMPVEGPCQKLRLSDTRSARVKASLNALNPIDIEKHKDFDAIRVYAILQKHLNLLRREIASNINRIAELEVELKASLYNENGKRFNARQKINSKSDLIWHFVDWISANPHHEQPWSMHPSFRSMITADLQTSMGEISQGNSILRKMSVKEYSILQTSHIIRPLAFVEFKSKIRFSGRLHSKPIAIRLKNVHFRRQFTATYAFISEDSDLTHHSLLNSRINRPSGAIIERINFIVPVNGRSDYFKKFLKNFKTEFCNGNEKVGITVVYFPSKRSSEIDNSDIDAKITPLQSDEISEAKAQLEKIKPFCSQQKIKFIAVDNGSPFSRALALQIGAERTRNDDTVDELLFFCDVTVALKQNVASNIRRNTIRGHQAFYPILFGEFSPQHMHGLNKKFDEFDRLDRLPLDEMSGLWSSSSYSVLSIYKSDFMSTEGFDLSHRGLGREEKKLCDAVMRKAKLKIFRSNEPNLFHIYHKKTCPTTQMATCRRSNAEFFGSQVSLYKLWIQRQHHGHID